jgi:hypothetical protein
MELNSIERIKRYEGGRSAKNVAPNVETRLREMIQNVTL